MERKMEQCCWCDGTFFINELAASRFLGGLVCPKCDADESGRTLKEIHSKLKERAACSIELYGVTA